MRPAVILTLLLLLGGGVARADEGHDGDDDGLSAAAALGAGGLGAARYGGLDLRLDARWRGIRVGLGARGVWLDGTFRRSDWARPADAVTAIRYLEAATTLGDGGRLALAAGGLSPAHVAAVVDGYRAALDGRPHAGARLAATTTGLEVSAELDDVLAPTVIAGAVDVAIGGGDHEHGGWRAHLATAIDPGTAAMAATQATDPLGAIELGAGRRFVGEDARAEAGAAVVVEPGLGEAVVTTLRGATDRVGARWSGGVELRAGTGTVGAAFGPLYRIERLSRDGAAALTTRARAGALDGASGALTLGVSAPVGWLAVALRGRPGLGTLATVDAGLPLGRWWQGAAWLAATPHDLAAAAAVRVAWMPRLFSALEAARLYQLDVMAAPPAWSATVWFGATTD